MAKKGWLLGDFLEMGNAGQSRKVELKTGDWTVKVKVWECLARTPKNRSAIKRELELHAGEEGYPKNILDKETIKNICNELSLLSPEVVSTLPVEVQSYARKLNPQLRDELERLKSDSSQQAQRQGPEQNPLIVEAKRKHFERLSKLIMTWQSQLGFKPKPSERYFVSIFPVKFKAQDSIAGSHEEKYFPYLRWQVAEDGAVDVRFLVEEDGLFEYLRLHIQSQGLWQNFEDFKNYLARGIREAAPLEEGRSIHVEEADALAANIFNELEIALAGEGVFPGKCPACPGY